MRLTRRQRTLFEEAEAIASMTNFDFHRIEDKDIDATLGLQIAIHKMVTGEVVIRNYPLAPSTGCKVVGGLQRGIIPPVPS
jgi:hypothetical protein